LATSLVTKFQPTQPIKMKLQKPDNAVPGRSQFLLRNLIPGIIWLAVIVIGYILASKYLGFDLKKALGPLYENTFAIFTLFLSSEVIFGIIPPEFFMFWALRHEDLNFYILNVSFLASISYVSGIIGYFFGAYFNTTRIYRFLRRKYLGKYQQQFNIYGGFLITVAALTPIPFSGVCMLMGSVKYPIKRFLLVSSIRFIRFAIYGWIVWKTLV